MQANVEGSLPRSLPEQQGVASSAILQFVEALESQMQEVHSFMLLRHGHVVADGWWSPYRAEYPHLLFSVSKSFTSTAIGFAVAEGRLSIDDPVLSFFSDERPSEVSDNLAAMTVRHLLTMTTGHNVDTWPIQVERSDGNWIKAFLNIPVAYPPGTYFLYNTGASYMLAAIVQKVTGTKLIDYLQPRLFDPLDIQNATWQESPQGIAVGGYGLSLTTEALARFGQLYLQKGRWGDRQVLPEDWVETAISAQVAGSTRNSPNDWAQGYGYQFWRSRHGAYQASGVFGQCCIVMPQQDAVLVFTSGIDVFESQELLDIVWRTLLPAFAFEQTAEVIQDHQLKLAKKLSSLAVRSIRNSATLSVFASTTARTYVMDFNELNIETVTLGFAESAASITFRTPSSETILDCGYGEWRHGRTGLLSGFWLSDKPTPVVCSGGWASGYCFRMVIRLIESPFFYTLDFHFIEDEMLLEIRVNVTLDIPRTLLLTAHLSLGVVEG